MIKYAVISLVLGLALAKPLTSQVRSTATLLRSNQELNQDGSFNYGYALDDGTKVEQSGYLKNPGTKEEGIFVQGSYSYVEPQGETISTKYTADAEHGVVVEGAHLPTPPPLPEHVKKLLAILYSNADTQLQREKVQRF